MAPVVCMMRISLFAFAPAARLLGESSRRKALVVQIPGEGNVRTVSAAPSNCVWVHPLGMCSGYASFLLFAFLSKKCHQSFGECGTPMPQYNSTASQGDYRQGAPSAHLAINQVVNARLRAPERQSDLRDGTHIAVT